MAVLNKDLPEMWKLAIAQKIENNLLAKVQLAGPCPHPNFFPSFNKFNFTAPTLAFFPAPLPLSLCLANGSREFQRASDGRTGARLLAGVACAVCAGQATGATIE
jgi:hypothetical protein